MVSTITHAGKWLTEYADRLVRLHQLIASEHGDSEAADDVRDEMDLPWRKMSEDEIQLAGDLSVDLYTITDSHGEPEPLRPEFKAQINDAIGKQKYVDALRLVRDNALQLDPSVAAFLRGICWSGLGLNSAAAEFFLHAERKQPGMAHTRLCALSTLISGRREQEALDLAQQWARDSDDASLVLKASEVVFLNAVRLPEDKARTLYEKTISLAARALKKYESAPTDPATDKQVIVALLQIAVSYARLGDMAKAREFCAQARNRSPDSVIAMTVDGMLNESAPRVSDATQVEVVRRIGASLTTMPSSEQTSSSFVLN